MKGYKGLEFHSPKTDQWMIGIGKYLVNFGAVEFLTYALIGALTDDEALYESTKKKQLSERLTLINKLAKNNDVGDELKSELDKIVEVAKDLSIFRNSLAHNPIFLVENTGNDNTSAYVGVPNMRKSMKESNVPIVDITKIELGVDAAAELAVNMDNALHKIQNKNA